MSRFWGPLDENQNDDGAPVRDVRSRTHMTSPVRRIRRLQEISQEELAARAGLHRTYVGEVERGERNPSIDVMERLAQGLSVSLAELVSESRGT